MTSAAEAIAKRVVQHLHPGQVVNLGIGLPTAVADYLAVDSEVFLHTENGMLGVGPRPEARDADPNLVNAGKQPVTALPGASYFSSSDSFAMIRGGHIDVAVLGALEIDEHGRIANWSLPGRPILGIGGAMDLIVGARKVIVATTHVTKFGEPKIVRTCRYPLTADRRSDLVVTDHATYEVDDEGLILSAVAEGSSLDWIRSNTDGAFRLTPTLGAEPSRKSRNVDESEFRV